MLRPHLYTALLAPTLVGSLQAMQVAMSGSTALLSGSLHFATSLLMSSAGSSSTLAWVDKPAATPPETRSRTSSRLSFNLEYEMVSTAKPNLACMKDSCREPPSKLTC